MTLKQLRDEIALQLASIQQSAGAIKSDDVVDDDACDAVVTSSQKIAQAFNEYLDDEVEPVDVPEDLEPSPYQE